MANEQMREFWVSGAEGWVVHRDLFEADLAPFSEVVLETASPHPGDHVLDIGCGTGSLIGGAIDAGATGVGVDIASTMIDAARALVPDAAFEIADAQTADLASLGPFTKVISRFGVMFFDDPAAAFANIRSAAAPEADLVFSCWRGAEENQIFSLGTSILLDRLEQKPPPPVPGAPGPMGLADPQRTRKLLEEAGWADISITAFDGDCDYGTDGSDGVERRLTMILNSGAGRSVAAHLKPTMDPAAWDALLDEVRAELRAHLVDGRVCFTGATWLVTARNPG